ncbi:testis-expressed protein 26 [Odontesthes bonariensis]|uniref:testis-expressed protein 26 n=1 Tax=Odontesthes bonariensis TaxID=219752 RepID=UPI003F58FFCA
MATKEGKQGWDPYETSHRKQFVYQPNSAPEIFLRPMSTSFIDSYSQSGHIGSTEYNKEFCWKPASKPECIRTGTASGQRRNNPHPSQAFMVWRVPRDASPSYEYVAFPWKCPPSEGEIRKALKAQYCSTYTRDFMGVPQGITYVKKAHGQLTPLQSRRCIHVPLPTETKMMVSYHEPKQKPQLLANFHQYSKRDPHVACCGIVPTVVQRHLNTQQRGLKLTTYDRFCGKRVSNVRNSLLSQDLQKLHESLPEEEEMAVKTTLNRDSCPKNGKKVSILPAVVQNSSSPVRTSSWPGPL